MNFGGMRAGFALLMAVCAGALAAATLLRRVPDATWYQTVHFQAYLYLRDQDAPWFAVVLAGALLLLFALALRPIPGAATALSEIARRCTRRPGAMLVLAALAAVLVFGTVFVHHSFLYSMDEYLTEFQARIFASGRLLAELPAEWRDEAQALQPYFVYQSPDGGYWGSGYRPVFAAIWALFSLISLGSYTNAVLSLLCLPLLVRLARRLWPEEPLAPVVAALLLLGSSQFVITGMSGFAWPAHLFFNLLWLNFFLRDDRPGHLLAGAVGFLALGLHQIHVHALFALPFVAGLLLARRWRPTLFYGAVYVAGVLIWSQWHRLALIAMGQDAVMPAGAEGATGIPYFDSFFAANGEGKRELDFAMRWPLMAANLFRFIAWQSPLLLPLGYVACRALRRAPAAVKCLGWGILLSFVVYLILMPNQMHGWGYRYFHSLIGNFVLIATYGWVVLWRNAADVGARGAIAVATIFMTGLSVLVALPLRAAQVEATVGPMAAAVRYLSKRPEPIVVLDQFQVWYGGYLFQNDPFLSNRPKVLALSALTPTQLAALCAQAPTPVLGYAALARFGVKPTARNFTDVLPEVEDLRRLAARDCK
jgi:hypothetical protein